ncbi:hypothetical protein BDQ94DRAFT_155217 [Aspergillus welwitschiae]|uniref:Uncharacterized protein n=1 Tax=Aspergillus welwitschiae TaxID=1341132 RepID=A0A3F3PI90_9EURO|nr:hypothetical protein BDQ94DRAFT_155217 [Aspergillus welwitschiae]RDH26628.1 hypothetical protein BDQ94DRAFT_155217 [Aspergillus welwitschiae]
MTRTCPGNLTFSNRLMPAQIARRRRYRKLLDRAYPAIFSSFFTGSLSLSFTVTLFSSFGASLPHLPSCPLSFYPSFSTHLNALPLVGSLPNPPLDLPLTATRDLRRRPSYA